MATFVNVNRGKGISNDKFRNCEQKKKKKNLMANFGNENRKKEFVMITVGYKNRKKKTKFQWQLLEMRKERKEFLMRGFGGKINS